MGTQKDFQPATITSHNLAHGFDTALMLAAGGVVNFGINSWGKVTEKKHGQPSGWSCFLLVRARGIF